MPVERLLDDDSRELVQLVREFSQEELMPRAAAAEAASEFPREAFRQLGDLGLLGLPYPEEYGGMELPYEVYLQALEEVAQAWMTVAVGASIHVMTAYCLVRYGTPEQRAKWVPDAISGEALGAYVLSETGAGSDVASMKTAARREGDEYVITGAKQWISHGSKADYYLLFARTGEGKKGVSCFYVPAGLEGLSFGAPEQKMGLSGSTTTAVYFDKVRIPVENRIGEEGEGLRISLSGLASGRLGIAACATGLAQGALDHAVAYAKEREQFGQRIADFQGLQFLLADMDAAVAAGRALYVDGARRRDAGLDYSRQSAIAKLVATDNAMRVTTDAVQVFGGYGYTRDFPVERFMREAKITQIFEGTNQIQRVVIGRDLLK